MPCVPGEWSNSNARITIQRSRIGIVADGCVYGTLLTQNLIESIKVLLSPVKRIITNN